MDAAKREALAKLRRPGIFADSATMGLQRPVAGAVEAMKFWEPGTMGSRFHGGMDQYDKDLNAQIEAAGPVSSTLQSGLGGMVMGGPSGSLVKQGLFDAGTAGVNSAASGQSWQDILGSMAMNAGMGGLFNLGGKGVGAAREAERRYMDTLGSAGIR